MLDAMELALPLLLAALLYAAVGHAGASGYLAVFALAGLAPASMKPAALALNIAVASIASVQFGRRFGVPWRLLGLLLLGSVPAAYLGGATPVHDSVFRILLGAALLLAAVRLLVLWREPTALRQPAAWVLVATGMAMGYVSGLTGVGGGIFLSPLLIFAAWSYTREAGAVTAPFILFNSVAGLLGLLHNAGTLPAALPWWVAAVVLGGALGSWWGTRRATPRAMRWVLALVLLFAATKLALS